MNLFLARFSLEQNNNKSEAIKFAEKALELARCDEPPYYKVAYDGAVKMLEQLSVSALH